jgi:hypothetical protein
MSKRISKTELFSGDRVTPLVIEKTGLTLEELAQFSLTVSDGHPKYWSVDGPVGDWAENVFKVEAIKAYLLDRWRFNERKDHPQIESVRDFILRFMESKYVEAEIKNEIGRKRGGEKNKTDGDRKRSDFLVLAAIEKHNNPKLKKLPLAMKIIRGFPKEFPALVDGVLRKLPSLSRNDAILKVFQDHSQSFDDDVSNEKSGNPDLNHLEAEKKIREKYRAKLLGLSTARKYLNGGKK